MRPCNKGRCPSVVFVRTRQHKVPPLHVLFPATGPYRIERCYWSRERLKFRMLGEGFCEILSQARRDRQLRGDLPSHLAA